MRLPGIGEIILILVIGAIVIIGVRVFGTPSTKKTKSKPRYEDNEEEEEDEDTRIIHHRRSRTQILGIVAIIIGVVILISTASMIKWVFWGPIGAFVIIAIGIVTIFMVRRRQP